MAKRKSTSIFSVILALIILGGLAVGLYFITDHFTNWHLNVDCIAGNHNLDSNGVCVSCKRQFATYIDLFVDGEKCYGEVSNSKFVANETTYDLTAKVMPENAVDKAIVWSTDNTDVATVDENGKVSIVGTGKATVTAMLKNGVSASCVFNIADTSLPKTLLFEHDKLYFPSSYLESDMLKKRYCNIYRPNGEMISCDLVWESSNESVALLFASNNLQTGILLVGEGFSTITATAPNGVKATATIYVGERLSLSIPDYDPTTVQLGDTYQISHEWIPDKLVEDRIHHWTSTNESVATIDRSSGLITITGEGEVTFRAYSSSGVIAKEITITVDLRMPKSVMLSWDKFDPNGTSDPWDNTISMSTNATGTLLEIYPTVTQLRAAVSPASAPQSVTWHSSDTAIVNVDETGKVTAVGNGAATITVTAENGVFAECTVHVDTIAEGIRINQQPTLQNPLLISAGERITLTATVLPANATLCNEITWGSMNTDVATVNENGVVTGVADGYAEIRASIGVAVASTTIEVCGIENMRLSLPEILDGVFDLTKYSDSGAAKYKYAVPFDVSIPLNLSVTPSAANKDRITYTSSNSEVINISGGKIKGKALGKADITVTAPNGVTAEMEVICTGRRGSDLFKGSLNLTIGETVSPFTELARRIVLEEFIRDGRIGNYEQPVGDNCNWFEYVYNDSEFSVDNATGNITALTAGEMTLSIIVYNYIYCDPNEELITVEIPVTVTEIPATLQAASWAQIQTMAADGTAAQYFSIGDEKTVTLTDGQELTFVLLDFNHDAEHSITFGLKGLYGTSAMNTANSNTANAAMAAKLAEVYDLLPVELKAVIRTVDKATTAGGKSRTIKTTQEQLFLFSEIEVTGVAGGTFAGEGSQYSWFANAANRVKDGKWLLRSPAKDSYTMFRAIYEAGTVGGINANVECGVCFGFCV
ncbi:MAG: Ig-like domain-containing protein [Corallococcus sp.]|nr:Ig-like domain-containing protein [Corallococcus sp.]MCM1359329.1 Ig-like domain-containing protein [Corallococcus sp.]MCM1394772.1 Ig-like domain-containing protein [Corallococcus sp.]